MTCARGLGLDAGAVAALLVVPRTGTAGAAVRAKRESCLLKLVLLLTELGTTGVLRSAQAPPIHASPGLVLPFGQEPSSSVLSLWGGCGGCGP